MQNGKRKCRTYRWNNQNLKIKWDKKQKLNAIRGNLLPQHKLTGADFLLVKY